MDEHYFPFSAIVNQEAMKDALLCNAVRPGIGGVLISGTRGTAKSTAARSLAHLLPRIEAVAGCPFNCPPADPDRQCADCRERELDTDDVEAIRTPFVTLPLGATEDRVLGSIDLEAAIQTGERAFEPGLLARANRGILYIDEVNLLSDHLVDLLLDVVAMGTNRVEREGISVEHPADVILVGTMNPEEGDLRPQLLDRFGLFVDMDRVDDPAARKTIVERRTRFEDRPEEMTAEWADAEAAVAERIATAREAFDAVEVDDAMLDRIVTICTEHQVDGLRADIVMHRTARAMAAIEGESTVGDAHVDRAAELALEHRAVAQPPPGPDGSDGDGDGAEEGESGDEGRRPPPEELPGYEASPDDGTDGSDAESEARPEADESADGAGADDRVFPIGDGIEPPTTAPPTRATRTGQGRHGRGARAGTAGSMGTYRGARRPRGNPTDLALDATLRAAAPQQQGREGMSGTAIDIRPSDVRETVRTVPVQNLVVFVVDSSGSMGAYRRMSGVKGAILSLLEDAYQQRDRVALVGFRGNDAEVLLPPTASVARATETLSELPTGGRTPLAAGLGEALRLVDRAEATQAVVEPVIVLVSDGRSNQSAAGTDPVAAAETVADRIERAGIHTICVDTETGPVRLGLLETLAKRLGGEYCRLDDLDPRELPAAIEDVVGQFG